MTIKRRHFTRTLGLGSLGLYAGASSILAACNKTPGNKEDIDQEEMEAVAEPELFFKISLAQWSLHKSYFGKSFELGWQKFGEMMQEDPSSVLMGDIKPIDFPIIARQEFGIGGVEYVNQFFKDKAEDTEYLNGLIRRAKDNDVQNLLIMCDGEGQLGNLDEKERIKAVENHYKWINAAKYLGCHSIRVNAAGNGTAEEVADAAVDGLGRLTEYGAKEGINVIVENHGGYSSNGTWLSGVMERVNSPYCGTLPDLGNFCIKRGPEGCEESYDMYKGVEQLMPYAKGVSGKTHNFDAEGNETEIDYYRMMQIIKDSGFNGWIDVEYEGNELSEFEGIRATKALLEKAGAKIS